MLNLPFMASFVPMLRHIGVQKLNLGPEVAEAAIWADRTQRLLSTIPAAQQTGFTSKYQNVPSFFVSVNNLVPGHFYAWRYEAKDDHYDEFPFVLVLNKNKTHCLGLNFHYLPYPLRLPFFEELLPLTAPIPVVVLSRIYITYQRLSAATRYRAFRPCVKQYKLSRFKSQPIFISPNEWAAGVAFPSEHFLGKDVKTVWTESTLDVKRRVI